jgi:hypothetical protein
MSLQLEKKRIADEITRYLRGRHNEDKMRIGAGAFALTQAASNFGVLALGLEAYKLELERLVARRNQARWFSHKPGQLHRILDAGNGRCQAQDAAIGQHAQRLTAAMTGTKAQTVVDWRRHGGGQSFIVNRRGFALDDPTSADIEHFLRQNGITNAAIVDYLSQYFNQNGLFAAGHLFTALCTQKTYPPSFFGSKHVLTSGRRPDRIHIVDTCYFDQIVSLETYESTALDPRGEFIMTYELVVHQGAVSMMNIAYTIAEIAAASADIERSYQEVLTDMATL